MTVRSAPSCCFSVSLCASVVEILACDAASGPCPVLVVSGGKRRSVQLSRNTIRGSAAAAGSGWPGSARTAVVGERGMWISRNDPIRGCAVRPGRNRLGPRRTAAADGGGEVRNANFAQRPYTRCADRPGRDGLGSCRAVWPATLPRRRTRISCNDPIRGVRIGRAGMVWVRAGQRRPTVVAEYKAPISRNDPIRGYAGRSGQDGLGPTARCGRRWWLGPESGFPASCCRPMPIIISLMI